MTFFGLESPALVALGLYVALGGLYLVVVPVALMLYLKQRSATAGSIERLFFYGLMLVFFPGCLLVSPFLNFRPQRREV
ncbi:MAG: NAD(P)H-quinone oxidoreductase subunit L [Cyanobacteria bacterium P01_D01_bin.1]